MHAEGIAARLHDPRTAVLGSALLIAGALWAATWTAMGDADLAAILCLPTGDAPPAPVPPDWSLATIAATALMWVLMMAAMMLPTAAPMLGTYAGLAAKEDHGARLARRVGLFAAGYLGLWSGAALAFALAQLLARGITGTEGGTQATPLGAGLLLAAAGAWQFSAVKQACLVKCRHPMNFLLTEWRDGPEGAFPLGVRHGLTCLGCCVGVMVLMFVFGAMNIGWMAAIALYCLAERVLPRAERWSRHVGAVLIAAGLAVLIWLALG